MLARNLTFGATSSNAEQLRTTLPEHAIRTAKSDKYRALGHYEALKNIDPAWGKEENWKIARLMTKDDLRGTDLDTFLEEL